VLVCKIKSRDVMAAYEQFSKNPKANLIGEVNQGIDGALHLLHEGSIRQPVSR